jgi:glycosyltransferase involved in cell wall biosynthesis
MEEKLNLSVILPIKSSLALNFDEYFNKAITSLKNQMVGFEELIIVSSNEEQLKSYLESFDFGDLNVVKLNYDGEPNYSSQINYGVSQAKGEWISFFEFDDEYASIWFKNVLKYSKSYPEVQAFLPVVVDVDDKEVFAGFTNEAVFAANFSQEMGYLTRLSKLPKFRYGN